MDKKPPDMDAKPHETSPGAAVEQDRANRLERELGAARQKLADHEQQVDRLKRELESQARTISQAENSLADLRSRLAQTESALVQRRHETEQTGFELAAAREELRQMDAVRQQNEKVLAGYKDHILLLEGDVSERQSAFAALEQAHAARMKEQYETFSATARQVKRVMADLDTARDELTTKLRNSQQQETRLKDEVVMLGRLVSEKQDEARRHEQQVLNTRQLAAREIGRIVASLLERSGRAYLFGSFRLRRRLGLLAEAGLVDPEWYLRRYPDVADAGIDPLRHYVEYGAREGREPNGLLAQTNGASQRQEHNAETFGPAEASADGDEAEQGEGGVDSGPAEASGEPHQPDRER
jgi:hypothetical protein